MRPLKLRFVALMPTSPALSVPTPKPMHGPHPLGSGIAPAPPVGCVVLGAAGSLAMVQGISQRDQPSRSAVVSAPWFAVVLLIATTALWVLSQPMEMRAVSILG